MTRFGRFGVLALTATAMLGTCACGGGTPATPSPGQSAPGRQWADYVTALRVDYTCVTDGTFNVSGVQIHSSTTSTVTEVTTDADRTRVVLSSTILTEAPGEPAQTVVQTQTYELFADGTMIAPAATLAGVQVEGTGTLTYPALETLSPGQTVQSSLTLTTPIPAGAEGAFQPILTPGETSLKLRVDMRVGFTPDAGPVSTAMGTFDDAVAVQVEFTRAELLNAAPDRTIEAVALAGQMVAFFPQTTTWYARGIGPVRSVATTAVTGEITTDTGSCTG